MVPGVDVYIAGATATSTAAAPPPADKALELAWGELSDRAHILGLDPIKAADGSRVSQGNHSKLVGLCDGAVAIQVTIYVRLEYQSNEWKEREKKLNMYSSERRARITYKWGQIYQAR